jgi:ammonia channel protein AmtB
MPVHNPKRRHRRPDLSNLRALGLFIVWFGWFDFNPRMLLALVLASLLGGGMASAIWLSPQV